MGRNYKRTCKSVKGLLICACVVVIFLLNGVKEVNAGVPYYSETGYGWIKENDTWSYLKADGTKHVNWLFDVDGNWYFMNQEGIMLTGWLDWKNQKYFLTGSGAMQTGWMTTSEGTYYFRPGNGDMFVGVNVIDGVEYNFGTDGKLIETQDVKPGEADTENIKPEENINENIATEDLTEIISGTAIVINEPEFAGPRYEEKGFGWKKTETAWNYINADGTKAINWVLDTDGTWYFMNQSGELVMGWIEWKDQMYYLTRNGVMQTGWMFTDNGTYYFRPGNGDMLKGVNVIDDVSYDFGNDGKLVGDYSIVVPEEEKLTGWQIIDGETYFYDLDGNAVTGIALIDGKQYGFTSEGILDNKVIPWNIVLVNYQNEIPEGFKISKSKVNGFYVDSRIAGSLRAMINAAKSDGVVLRITSAYRTLDTQKRLYNNALNKYLNSGLSYEEAVAQTNLYHAETGKSEHNLGLAIDFIYGSTLSESFAYSAAGIWLMEHAHEYGFILRYEEDTTDITHIAYEPWHYRFVGVDVAKHIHSAGVCFEDYFLSYSTIPAEDAAEESMQQN